MFKRNGYLTARVGKIFHYGNPGRSERAAWTIRVMGRVRQPSRHRQGRRVGADQPDACAAARSALAYYASPAPDEQHTDGKVAAETIALLERTGTAVLHRRRLLPAALSVYRAQKVFRSVSLDSHSGAIAAARLAAAAAAWFTTPPNWDVGEEGHGEHRAYYASITFLDANVGRLLDALDRLKRPTTPSSSS